MTATEILNEYISRKQLAADLKLAEATLIRWEKDGRGPPVTRIGRKILYRREAVIEWMRAQEAKS